MPASTTAPKKLSVNALLVSPLRVRWNAVCVLWRYHGCWRLAPIRQRMKGEMFREIAETMPMVLLVAMIAAVMIFVVLPASLREQGDTLLAALWPVWVVQAVPMVCALILAMLNAPAIALRYVELHAAGGFAPEPEARDRRMAALALPQIFAHAAVCAVISSLLVMFTLVLGIVAELVWAVGDLRSVLATLLASASPWAWLRSLSLAATLGAVCALSAVLLAWPGALSAANAKDTHRIGVWAIIVASAACALTGLALNWVSGLLGWGPGAL
jgi:hypothetical protein